MDKLMFLHTLVLLHTYVLLYYVIWLGLFVKRLSQKAIQRRSQCDRLVKIKVFKLRRDADDIPCNITLRSAGGVSFQSAIHHSKGPILGYRSTGPWYKKITTISRAQRTRGAGRWRFRHELTEIFHIYALFGLSNQEKDLVSNPGQDWGPVQLIEL